MDFVGLRPCPPITCNVRYVLSLAAGAQKFGEVYKSQFSPELGQYFPFYSVTLKQKLKETQDKVQEVHKSSMNGVRYDANNPDKGQTAVRDYITKK